MTVETLRALQAQYMAKGYNWNKAFELAFYQLKRERNGRAL
jgi:hypothetical protein